MMKKSLVAFLMSTCLMPAGALYAQDGDVVVTPAMPVGGPQPGVEIQYRYTNPGDSQQLLNAAPAASEASEGGGDGVRALDTSDLLRQRYAAQQAAAGEDGEPVMDPFVNQSISSVSAMGSGGAAMAMIVGASIYRGVTPNEHDSLPHISRYQSIASSGGANQLTWIGFQPFQERTRVFVQTGRSASHSVISSPDGRTLTIRLPSTRIPLSNFHRDIDASYFDRAVTHVRANRAGDATDVVIELGRTVRYEVTQDAENPSYLYIDFFENESAE